jgi:hypothetical protein
MTIKLKTLTAASCYEMASERREIELGFTEVETTMTEGGGTTNYQNIILEARSTGIPLDLRSYGIP